MHLFIQFSCLIKWFFYKNFELILFFSGCHHLIMIFVLLLPSYYDVCFVVGLLSYSVFHILKILYFFENNSN